MTVLKLLLLLLPLVFALTANAAYDVTDDRGRAVTFTQPPMRVVALLPSLTESVCELGACERLVGVDSFSNWPARVAELPHLGGVDDVSIERVVALKPDLVLLGSTSRSAARLADLGLNVMGLDIRTLADVRRVMTKIGQALAVPRADAGWKRIEDGIAAAARSVPPDKRGITVYFEITSDGYAASASSHIGEILARLGAVDVVPAQLGTVPKLNPEFVVRADPQVIVMSQASAQRLKDRPGWDRIRAVRDGRICALTSAQDDVVARPGPRLAEAARVLAQCLRGAQ
ncbi:MAG TPA: helical backbone metal receptor [Ramlibacter sp.]|uniref:ABC transporter substrate-binding protein n=1 Tax=Ramlibacter sp. TaxID=1917967 RepID=UPI002CEE6735|nr:helical backbone metal receptor [Ramlibacter sp.]HVZ44726.1 helical backbone metal receptor [Ramlibacter sp.]